MLTLLRRLPWRTAQPCPVPSCCRNITSSTVCRAEVENLEGAPRGAIEPPDDRLKEGAAEAFEERQVGRNSAQMLDIFLETEGARFKKPWKPNNWLAADTPFPLNHSFKPPIPVSDKLRTIIYRQFMTDPNTNSVRVLAGHYHLSMKRVDAILRLKGLEEHWKQNKPLQTGFLAGMEWCLGVRRHEELSEITAWRETEHPRYNVREADALMEAEANDSSRLRYSKMFWEAVPDGKDPVVPLLLLKARLDGIRHAQEEEESKNHPRFVPPQPGTDKLEKVKMVAPSGRPMIKFVDVGGKFINKHESLKRTKHAEHRGVLHARKREEAQREAQRRAQMRTKEKEQRWREARQVRRAIEASKRAEKEAAKAPNWQSGGGRSLVLS